MSEPLSVFGKLLVDWKAGAADRQVGSEPASDAGAVSAGEKAAPAHAGTVGAVAFNKTPMQGNGKSAPVAKGLTASGVVRLVDTLVYLSNPHFYQRPIGSPGPAKLAFNGKEPVVDDLLLQAAEVIQQWRMPNGLPKAVQIWHGVEPKLKAVISQAADPSTGLVDSAILDPARSAIATISSTLTKADGDSKKHELNRDEKIEQLQRSEVIQTAGLALLVQYNELETVIGEWADGKNAEIQALEPHQTPKSGAFVISVAKEIVAIGKVAFPELAVIEVAGKLIEYGEKAKGAVDQTYDQDDKDSETETKAAKIAAMKNLGALKAAAKRSVQSSQAAIEAAVESALGQDPTIIEELNRLGDKQSQYQKIREVLSTRFGIRRGTDADSGVFGKLTKHLDSTFKKGLKTDYQERHMGKVLTDAAGSDDKIRGVLARLYHIYVSDDPEKMTKIEKGIADAEAWYLKAYGIGGPWGFRKALYEMIKKQDKGYEDVFKGSDLHEG